jgi:hypothetical protein
MDERRKSERRGKVEVEWKEGDGPTRKAHAENISAGGAFIVTKGPFPEVKTRISVVVLSVGGPIPLLAEVRWTSDFRQAPGIGVEFVEPSEALTKFLATLA